MDAIGFDAYNQCLTGRVAKTLNSRATDSDHLPCVVEVIGVDIYNLALTRDKACSLTSEGWTSTGTCPKVLILDHHPNDSRTDIAEDQQAIQTLTSRMGTGGGNVPMILEYHSQALRIKPLEDDVSPTIPAGFGEGGANTTTPRLIVEPITYDAQVTNPLHKDNAEGGVCHTLNSDSRNYVVIPLEGNGARPSHHGDGYRKSGPMYSLNTTEVHGVAYSTQLCGDRNNPSVSVLEEKAFCIPANPMSDRMKHHEPIVCYKPIAVLGGGREHSTICMDDTAPTLCTFQDSKPILIARIDNAEIL